MRIIRNILLTLILFSMISCESQPGNLSGNISDSSNNQPISNAKIVCTAGSTDFVTQTDSNGYYSINLPVATYQLKVTNNGYQSKSMDIYITEEGQFSCKKGSTKIENIKLIPSANQSSLNVSVDAISFSAADASKGFYISYSGSGILSWTVTSSASWLTVNISSGTTTTETDYITVNVDRTNLPVGTSNAILTVIGANTTKTINVTVEKFNTDNIVPTISISSPTSNTIFNTTAITVTIQYLGSDNKTSSSNLKYSYKLYPVESIYSSNVSSTTKSYSSLGEGSYTFYVKCIDEDGNSSNSASINFMIDITGPTLPQYLSPQNNSTITQLMPSFDWTDSTDTLSGLSCYWFALATDPDFGNNIILLDTNVLSSNYTLTNSLNYGTTYYWVALPFDKADNYNVYSAYLGYVFSFTIQPSTLQLPTITLASTDEDGAYTISWTSVSSATYYKLQEDDNSSFSSPTLIYNGSNNSYSISSKADGTYYYRVLAGNSTIESSWSSIKSIIVQRPVTPETVSTPNTPSGDISGFANITYTYSIGGSSSNKGHTIQYIFDWDDGSTSGWLSSTSASHSWSSAGTYYVKAQARCATHTSVISEWTSFITVTIIESDVTPPTISFSDGPSNNSYLNSSPVSYSISGSDNVTSSNNLKYSYKITSPSGSVTTNEWLSNHIDISIESVGSYTVAVKCKDESDNISDESSRSFTFDNVNPSISITSGPSGTINTTSTSFTFSGSDNISSSSNLQYSYYLYPKDSDYGNWVSSNLVNITNLTPGSYTFYVMVKDQAGNIKPTSRSFNVMITVTKKFLASYDAYVAQKSPNESIASSDLLCGVNASESTRGLCISYIKFDISNIPSSSTINWASLCFYTSQIGQIGSQVIRVEIYPLSAWWGSSVTYNTKPSQYSTPYATKDINTVSRSYGADITEIVKKWHSGAYTNYGVVLYPSNVLLNANELRRILSVESGNKSDDDLNNFYYHAPFIEVNYTY